MTASAGWALSLRRLDLGGPDCQPGNIVVAATRRRHGWAATWGLTLEAEADDTDAPTTPCLGNKLATLPLLQSPGDGCEQGVKVYDRGHIRCVCVCGQGVPKNPNSKGHLACPTKSFSNEHHLPQQRRLKSQRIVHPHDCVGVHTQKEVLWLALL